MPDAINGLSSLPSLLRTTSDVSPPSADSAAGGVDFQNMLLDAVGHTNQLEHAAQSAIEQYELGSGITKPEVFVAMRKAELALRMTMQIRNKVLEAYDEIRQMRM